MPGWLKSILITNKTRFVNLKLKETYWIATKLPKDTTSI